jgi:indole-3-glycerol phosphate synthase
MTSLSDIVAANRRKVDEARATADVRDLERRAASHVPREFRRALETASKAGVAAVIAELKKASPSRGLIRNDFNPGELAQELEEAGAAALSILTDEEFFQGSLANLRAASNATQLPCLRKDFIVDEFQILEARANNADAVLLIVAALSKQELKLLAKRAAEFELDVLCEVHDELELGSAMEIESNLVGVNSRDLRTFKVDLDTAFRVAQMLPPGVIAVAESGIENGAEVTRLRSAGYDAFLIGETLMKAQSPSQALRSLLSEAASSASGGK